MYFRLLALSLLLFSLGARPAESALITITNQTPFVKISGVFLPTDGIYGGLLRVMGFGGFGFYEASGSTVATFYSTDTQRIALIPLMGSTLLSAQVWSSGPFFVGSTSFAAGSYTLDLTGGVLGGILGGLSFGPGFPSIPIPERTIDVLSVTLQTVPEPSLTLMVLLGGTWLVRRSWARRRGRAAVP